MSIHNGTVGWKFTLLFAKHRIGSSVDGHMTHVDWRERPAATPTLVLTHRHLRTVNMMSVHSFIFFGWEIKSKRDTHNSLSGLEVAS